MVYRNAAREIAGKTKSKDEQMYGYREDMTRHKIEEGWDPFIRDWKIDIYQKNLGFRWIFGMVLRRIWA